MTLQDNREVLELLSLQLAAYRVEAELIGFNDIPPLKDSIQSIRQANETFIGYYDDNELAGAISYSKKDGSVTICRMMVHPNHFRKGIASKLLSYVLDREKTSDKFIVSTGAANIPAIELYKRHGFKECSAREIAPGIILTTFEKTNEK
jgi:ribosomal protein S18 acetylase RimI-like enzyme